MRLDRTFLKKIKKFLHILSMGSRFSLRPGPPEHANNRCTFEQRKIQRELWNGTGSKPNNQVATVPGHTAEGGFSKITPDGIIDHVRTGASGQLFNPRLEVLAGVVDTFLRTVSRYPTHKEMEMARTDLSKAPNVVAGVQELLLALLNTKEFMVNH